MTSSLLERVKNKPRTPEEFVAEADSPPAVAAPPRESVPVVSATSPVSLEPLPRSRVAPVEDSRGPAAGPQDPQAAPTTAFNLRFNDYEMDLLRRVTAAHSTALGVKVSQHTIAKKGALEYIEQLARRYGVVAGGSR